MIGSIEYCARGIVAYLDGNIKLFEEYKNKAIEIYKRQIFEESCIYSIQELIPEEVKEKLHKTIS